MTGTIQELISLALSDGGQTWEQVSAEPYSSPMNCHAPGIALPDGTIVRSRLGQYLPFYDVPQTGYVQHSTDGAKSWGPPQVIIDPERFMAFPERLRLLRDGRLVLIGGLNPQSPEIKNRFDWYRHLQMHIWISEDGGHSWCEPIPVLPPQEDRRPCHETDFAELPDGRLLFIHRMDFPRERWQSVLRPEGDQYVLESAGPSVFPISGRPNLLATRDGVVLHLASTGIHWTADGGQTWHDLAIEGTGCYPRSVQLADGRIFCLYHRGSFDPYDGSVDQEIQALTFRLQVEE